MPRAYRGAVFVLIGGLIAVFGAHLAAIGWAAVGLAVIAAALAFFGQRRFAAQLAELDKDGEAH